MPSLWKKYLSYLFEFHIESAPSEYNPHLYVSLSRGRYQLCTANAIYSFEDLYDNFGLTFEKIDLNKIPGKRVLILGFGLGSIPILLEKKFKKKYTYTAVEIDESVIYLANKYGVSALHSPIEMICADALTFVQVSQEKFDLICMDVFLDDIIPQEFQQNDFLEVLKNMLTPKGILLYNRLSLTEADLAACHTYYDEVFSKVFPNGTHLEVKGNWMLLNNKEIIL